MDIYRDHRHMFAPVTFSRQLNHQSCSHDFPCFGCQGFGSGDDLGSSDRQGDKAVAILGDGTLDCHGDLAWSLDYATAWCYRHLVGNQPEVVDVIDHVRELDSVNSKTPYLVFDYLDGALFGSKLKGMVFLRWKSQASSATGTTSAPGVAGVPRICIDLNKTPFETDDTDVDDLLEALVHHMIHAFFLVCCGAPIKGEKQDGRLLDAVHFGVILLTIDDISNRCQGGPLRLVFHACKQLGQNFGSSSSRRFGSSMFGRVMPEISGRNGGSPTYILLDPKGNAIDPGLADGQTHCLRDNRSVTPQHLKTWQIEKYAAAIELDMQAKGDVVYKLDPDGCVNRIERLKGPPSSSFIELIWDGKRIMASREKAFEFASLSRLLLADEPYTVPIPPCPIEMFKHIFDFINLGRSWKDTDNHLRRHGVTGPPILLVDAIPIPGANQSIIMLIRVFKAAVSMEFAELTKYTLQRLYRMPTTSDDPIAAMKEVYNDAGPNQSVHSDLQRWARKFLCQTEDLATCNGYDCNDLSISNYQKILQWHSERLEEFYHRNTVFKEDVQLIVASLAIDAGTVPSSVHRPLQLQSPLQRNNISHRAHNHHHQHHHRHQSPFPALAPLPLRQRTTPIPCLPLSDRLLDEPNHVPLYDCGLPRFRRSETCEHHEV